MLFIPIRMKFLFTMSRACHSTILITKLICSNHVMTPFLCDLCIYLIYAILHFGYNVCGCCIAIIGQAVLASTYS